MDEITDTADIHDELRGERLLQPAFEEGDHAPQHRRDRGGAKRKFALPLAAALLLAAALSPAPASEPEAGAGWLLLPEPSSLRSGMTWPIPGARRTAWVATRLSGEGRAEPVSREAWAAAGGDFDALRAATAALGDRLAEKAGPEMERDRHGVILYGTIRSEEQTLGALLLSGEFRRRMEPLFGPGFLVAIPNRYTIFLFPKHAGEYADYAPMVLDAYRATPHPASAELFEMPPDGPRAAGLYGE